MRGSVRRTTVLLSSLALVAGGTAVTAAPAWAGQDSSIADLRRGLVQWKHDGDKIRVKDTLKDGYWVEGHARRVVNGQMTGRTFIVQARGGHNSEKTSTWDLREGTRVNIRMCYMKGNVEVWCTGWRTGGVA
ncbi:hypothetical protein OHR68_24050 [Spirillospora sp. NBC_00431]